MPVSLFQVHASKWKTCTDCGLHKQRTKVVIAKGKLPCDILFIGDSPSESDDVIGQPFVGPAGYLLDEIIEQSIRYYEGGESLRVGFTMVLGCIAKNEEGVKIHELEKDWINACSSRLSDLITIAKPKAIVSVGGIAEKILMGFCHDEGFKSVSFHSIAHPAAILRARVDQQGIAKQRTIITLRGVAAELLTKQRGG